MLLSFNAASTAVCSGTHPLIRLLKSQMTAGKKMLLLYDLLPVLSRENKEACPLVEHGVSFGSHPAQQTLERLLRRLIASKALSTKRRELDHHQESSGTHRAKHEEEKEESCPREHTKGSKVDRDFSTFETRALLLG